MKTKKSDSEKNNDARIKSEIVQIISNCKLSQVKIDREVQLNYTGKQSKKGDLAQETEIDVVVSFRQGSKKALLLFEAENSNSTSNLNKEYLARKEHVRFITERKQKIKVIHSKDGQITDDCFIDVDQVSVCYVYGERITAEALENCIAEATKHNFVVWGASAMKYYKKISSTLGQWTRYELYKEFGLNFQNSQLAELDAMPIKQKNQKSEMYLAKIHPGQLLQIAYVVRRTSQKTHAYQRMLNRQRIESIARFIESSNSHALLPNTLIIVFDDDESIQKRIQYDAKEKKLTIPMEYCSAWIIDGQHRAYGFIGTKYEEWDKESFEGFDLPIVIFKDLEDIAQTQTFIDINYNQKKIKPDLLCDLATVTKDLNNPLTWCSLLGIELNKDPKSPLRGKIKVSEFDTGTLSLSSFVKYGLLVTLLGYKTTSRTYSGRLYAFAPFNDSETFSTSNNQVAFEKQFNLLRRFLVAVHFNTSKEKSNPWDDSKKYALIKPSGMNALFLVLAKIIGKYPKMEIDLNKLLKPLSKIDFTRENLRKKGTGWQGFREFANEIIEKINDGKKSADKLTLYGEKDKV